MDRATHDTVMATAREWELPHLNDAAGIDDRWLQSFLAARMADLLAQVAIGERLKHLPPPDRAWFLGVAEATVRHAITRYQFPSEVC